MISINDFFKENGELNEELFDELGKMSKLIKNIKKISKSSPVLKDMEKILKEQLKIGNNNENEILFEKYKFFLCQQILEIEKDQ